MHFYIGRNIKSNTSETNLKLKQFLLTRMGDFLKSELFQKILDIVNGMNLLLMMNLFKN